MLREVVFIFEMFCRGIPSTKGCPEMSLQHDQRRPAIPNLRPRPIIPVHKLGEYLPVKRSQREQWIADGLLKVYRYPGTRVRFVYADDVVALQANAKAVAVAKAAARSAS
jgi:hypothetical protein